MSPAERSTRAFPGRAAGRRPEPARLQCRDPLRGRLMVGRLTLDQVVKVRVLAPQPHKQHERGARRCLMSALCQKTKLAFAPVVFAPCLLPWRRDRERDPSAAEPRDRREGDIPHAVGRDVDPARLEPRGGTA
jgi:hypothetical protein